MNSMNAGSLLQPLGSTMFEEIAMCTGKSLKTLITFACLVTLTLGLAGCRKKTSPYPKREDTGNSELQVAPALTPTPAPGSDVGTPEIPTITPKKRGESDIVPLQGVGLIDFGMYKEEVIGLLGEPGRDEGGGIVLYYLQSRGLSLMFNYRGGVREIHCWSKEYPEAPPKLVTFQGKTDKGIAMDATRGEIIAAYGQPDEVITKAGIDTLRYDKIRTDFVVHQNKLINIKVKAPKPAP